MKRKVIDDIVKIGTPPTVLYSNTKLKEMKITETTRVSDKREPVVLNKRSIPDKISLISNVESVYNMVAKDSDEGVIDVQGRANLVIPLPNLKLLKALASCCVNANEEYSSALAEMFRYILRQTMNRKEASDDGVITESGTKLQVIVKKKVMQFYLKVC